MPRLRIGLTGGIASGKSTAAGRFVELGVPVIDADDSARRVVAPGEPGLDAVTRAFGRGVVTAARAGPIIASQSASNAAVAGARLRKAGRSNGPSKVAIGRGP